MKIIINQNKEIRTVGYDSVIGINPLETEYYLAKSLNPKIPVYCVINNKFYLLMHKIGENENYLIYKPFDLVNIKYEEGYKKIKIIFNKIKSNEKELFFSALEDKTLLSILGKEV